MIAILDFLIDTYNDSKLVLSICYPNYLFTYLDKDTGTLP